MKRRARPGCTGKLRHASPEAALAALESTVASDPTAHGKLHIYRCDCGSYHVGHYRTARGARR